MKISVLLSAAVIAVALTCNAVRAADEAPKPAAPAAAETPATVIAPTDLGALREALGNEVAVEGTIVASGESKSKTVRYLNFTKNYRESIALVFFGKKGGEEFSAEKLATWVGKKIRATGKVSDHSGALQIEIEKKEQLQELP